ncbi:MAG: ABC transporter permease [Cypionkella sp.]|nr:ABC transporter permease [Cypionkella sp.]
MFRVSTSKSTFALAWGLLELIFHSAVRHIRKSHGNALIGLIMAIMQTVIMVGVMVFMMNVLGMRRMAVRGDFVLYMMSGVINFMAYTQTLGAVAGSDGPTSAMMKHSPMNPLVAIVRPHWARCICKFCRLGRYCFFTTRCGHPSPSMSRDMLWERFLCRGCVRTGYRRRTMWQPELIGTLTKVYSRMNMLFSGKMMLANSTPGYILALYTWNPLFHTIDQTRGFTFANYHPHYSSITYPIYVSLALVMLGLMGEQHYSNRQYFVVLGGKMPLRFRP